MFGSVDEKIPVALLTERAEITYRSAAFAFITEFYPHGRINQENSGIRAIKRLF
jgi:hypothetical protein